MKVTVDIDCDENRICVWFPSIDQAAKRKVRNINGRSFVKRPTHHWHVPKDMMTCRRLRKEFGRDLVIGPKLHSWATLAAREEQTLGSLALADTGTFQRLPDVLPMLAMCLHVGPIGLTYTDRRQWADALKKPGSFQVADVRFLVESTAPLNGNEQGLGKTPEWIAAVWEGGWERGDHLVVAKSAAVDGTWEPELERWQGDAPCGVGIFCCTGSRKQRERTLAAWRKSKAPVRWVVVNPEMIQWKKDGSRTAERIINISPGTKKAEGACRCQASRQPHEHYELPYPELDWEWDTFCIDEAHKGSIRNHRTVTSQSLRKVRVRHKQCAMSGTLSKKKGQDLWSYLNWQRPDVFTSMWRWAGEFFDIEENEYGKKIGGLRPERAQEFFASLKPYLLRRTKAEAAPWLPAKLIVPVWCTMEGKQLAKYQQMEKEAVAKLTGGEVSVQNVLAQFTRLQQFANALCVISEGTIVPSRTSCKLDAMLDKMEEDGMFGEGSTTKQVVFSQSARLVRLVAEVLKDRGLDAVILSGKENHQGQRRRIKEAFQTGNTRVLCVVTTAGGVSLTLDAADTAHFLDVSWAPDDQVQAEDRLHRVSRVHNVTVYQYLTHGTIDEYKMDTAMDKAEAQNFIMDVRRKLLKEAA